jgi:glycosyltransferase involved in cell wall biosynthesis
MLRAPAEDSEQDRRTRVLVLSEFYLPAFRAGGPVRTLVNLIDRLGDEIAFSVVAGDRDLGDQEPFHDFQRGTWTWRGGYRTLYIGLGWRSIAALQQMLRAEPYDVLYVNSLFSRRFAIVPLLLRRLGLVPRRPLVLAPRGELSRGALSLNPRRKRAFLRLARATGLYRGVRWQASSTYEADEIRALFGQGVSVAIAANLTGVIDATTSGDARAPKKRGRLRLAFLSRVAPKKNLLGALELLDGLEGDVSLDVHGPIEDRAYWARCEARIARLPTNVSVRYRGPVPYGSASDVLAGYDALLLPTLGENFGHAIFEALAAGCPVVVSDTTPWRDLEARHVGWDISLDAPDRFRAVLGRLAAMGAEEHRSCSHAARDYAVEVSTDPVPVEANRRLFALEG